MNVDNRWSFRQVGALYILAGLFLVSWVGQTVAMWPTIQSDGWAEWWAATLENWQSEFLQLLWQAALTYVWLSAVFRRAERQELATVREAIGGDLRRLEAKVDALTVDRGPR